MPSDAPENSKREGEARPREEKTKKDDKETVQPSHEKIPEGPGNLRRRAEWFQKRSGQTP